MRRGAWALDRTASASSDVVGSGRESAALLSRRGRRACRGLAALIRVALGPTRDVVLIDAEVREVIPAAELPAEVGDAFAAKTGFHPREQRGAYPYFRVVPLQVQAWREANELAGRDLMIDGRWLSDPES
ncbi:hypothetical protein [Nonomuraea dietziae]|uniref:hypothetical protein n=1 Tax=Nonomuraea dietziae TaxID=65515 RepID=UPI003437DFE0